MQEIPYAELNARLGITPRRLDLDIVDCLEKKLYAFIHSRSKNLPEHTYNVCSDDNWFESPQESYFGRWRNNQFNYRPLAVTFPEISACFHRPTIFLCISYVRFTIRANLKLKLHCEGQNDLRLIQRITRDFPGHNVVMVHKYANSFWCYQMFFNPGEAHVPHTGVVVEFDFGGIRQGFLLNQKFSDWMVANIRPD